jgi:uncharacterized membrane protein YfcA
VSGLGFSLISVPFLVLLLGPYDGATLANALAICVALMTLATSRRMVDRRRAMALVPAGLVGVVPGVVATRLLPAAPLQVFIGGLLVVGLLLTVAAPRDVLRPTVAVNTGAGLASGFMTATAAIGGPALAVYGHATGWEQASFAATVQISFASQSAVAIGLKGLPHLRADEVGLLALAVLAGLAIGGWASSRLSVVATRHFVIGLALLGATATLIKGVLAWHS